MKNIDKKKLFIFIGIIILVIALIISLVLLNVTKEKPVTDEEKEALSKVTLNYINKLTLGYDTNYNGIDVLYEKDESKYEDLSTSAILTTATRYVNNELDNAIKTTTLESIANSKNINTNNYTFYTGENIRKAIKILFNKDFEDTTSMNVENYLYNYTYLSEFDMYLQSKNKTTNNNYNTQLDFKILETTKTKKDTYQVKLAVAYVNIDNTNLKYAKDSKLENIIFETTTETPGITDEKVNEFNQYTITFKKVDNQYTFESIKKA